MWPAEGGTLAGKIGNRAGFAKKAASLSPPEGGESRPGAGRVARGGGILVVLMSNRTRNLHAWRTRLEDGRKREVRAQLFGAQWTISSRCQDEEEWTVHDPPSLEDLEALHETLFNKYQRKHLAWEHVESVQKLIEARNPAS